MEEFPFVSVVIPTLNEDTTIAPTLERLVDSCYPSDLLEFLVVDGGSSDKTRAIAEMMAVFLMRKRGAIIRVIDNPHRRQSAAINLAAEVADPRSEWLIRCDCHAEYSFDFVWAVMRAISDLPERDYAGVVYAVRSRIDFDSSHCFRNASAWAFCSKLGGGNSAYRTGTPTAQIDHGWHGAFNREILRSIGGYDTEMVANEDVDLSWRLRNSGYKLWIAGNIQVNYITRDTPRALWKQFSRYGHGRALLMERHRGAFKPRHLPLVAIVPWTVLLIVTTPVVPVLWLTMVPYVAVLAAVTLYAVWSTGNLCLLWLPLVLAVMHSSWGCGFIAQSARMVRQRLLRNLNVKGAWEHSRLRVRLGRRRHDATRQRTS
jgi:succinoglycan biosynthesis protein ExoA